MKGIQIAEKGLKASLFAENIIKFVENHQESTKTTTTTTNKQFQEDLRIQNQNTKMEWGGEMNWEIRIDTYIL